MNTRLSFSRRQFALATTGLLTGAAGTLARAAEGAWSPEDGLRLAGPYHELESLDPALARDLDTIFLTRQICRGLVGYDDDLLAVPELARTVERSGDGLVYTFTLREDARFHDGRAVEADDVVFSLTRALAPATAGGDLARLPGPTYLADIAGASALMQGASDSLEGVVARDSRTVEIALERPSSTFLMRLAAMPAAILDRHQAMDEPGWWQRINGSGPYRLASFDVDGMRLEAAESWAGEIAVRQIEVRLGIGAAQPVNLFQNGVIDLVPTVPPELVSLVQDPASGLEGISVLETPEFALAYIALGNQHPPLDDVHIRRALQRVFPAARFAEGAYDGRVREAEGIIPPGMLGHDWAAEMPPVDVDAAREEIAASRYGAASEVPTIRIRAADIAAVEALRDVARDALGLAIEAVQVDWLDFLEGLSARKWDAYSVFWGADYPDPEALLDVLFRSDSPDNYTGYMNPALDALLAEARIERDDDTRVEILMQAQQLLIDDAAIIPLYVPIRYTLTRAGMTRVPVTPMGLLGLEALA